MTDLLILGTDTDAGKTTFALLWLAAFGDRYEYWKPVETGASDTERVRVLVPTAEVHPPAARFEEAVAPPLAARREGKSIPPGAAIAARKPALRHSDRRLLIETFGSPLSPLTETELQLALIHALAAPTVLVASSAVGAVGRTLQALQALTAFNVHPAAVVLLGPADAFAAEQVARHWPGLGVFALQPPATWDKDGVAWAARVQIEMLAAIRNIVNHPGRDREGAVTRGHNQPLPDGHGSEIIHRDRRLIWHPYTALREPEPPLVCVGAQDEFLQLADGRRVIDGISSWWTILHGHRHPVLMEALRNGMAALDHVHFAGVTHPDAVELAELLLGTAPWPDGRVFYSDNGSTAVEVALKMAYQYWCHQSEPRRTLFIGFENGYHGDTFGAMAVGRDPVFFGRFEPLLFGAETVPVDPERLDEVLRHRRGQVAAVIIEPLVQGAGGMRMHTPQQLRDLSEVARNHGVLFIADEAMTGGGRLGPLWAHQAADIAPDLICAAKTLAGGVLPLAATLAAPHVVAAWDTADPSRTFFHGHSFTAHPLACAVAVANWRMLRRSPPPAPMRLEKFWREALEPLRDHPRVRDIRIRGTIAALEVQAAGGYLAPIGRQFRRVCLEHGVLLRPLGNVLYALPPFCTSETSLRQIAEAMLRAVESL